MHLNVGGCGGAVVDLLEVQRGLCDYGVGALPRLECRNVEGEVGARGVVGRAAGPAAVADAQGLGAVVVVGRRVASDDEVVQAARPDRGVDEDRVGDVRASRGDER